MSDPIQQARVDLAAALRLAVRFGFNEGIDNHFTYAVPGTDDRFLLHPYGMHWSEVTASDLLVVDRDGTVLEGEGEVEVSAFAIHAPLHQRHPGARCVLHTHMPYATALTAVEAGRLEPVNQNSLRFHGDVAYDDHYNGLACAVEEGERMVEVLGAKRVLFLANHGVLVVGETVAGAFDDLYFLERACQLQVLAMSTGRPLKRLSENMAAHTAVGFKRNAEAPYGQVHFAALKRILDREQPGYAA
jgi:ribulose-5-phosphate 4-epimerase/fuculose-1-phosphate aldolase